jgi:FKBP-type peptidyl-prolyl cis-trans isomerase 2
MKSSIGTSIMNDIIEYADKTKKIVVLTPSDAYGGNKNRLVQFYKRFGFKMNKGVHKNYKYMDLMIRYPNLSEEVKEYIKESVKKILS